MMNTNVKRDAISELEFSGNAILGRILDLNQKTFNERTSPDRWSAGQITEHLLKSLKKVSGVVNTPGEKTKRQPDQYEPALKELMLDLSEKRKSSEDIFPANQQDFKEISQEFQNTLRSIVEKAHDTDLAVIPEKITFHSVGAITKMEWLYFAAYHIQRHWFQLRNLQQSLQQQRLLHTGAL